MDRKAGAFEVLNRDEVEGVLSGAFYRPMPPEDPSTRGTGTFEESFEGPKSASNGQKKPGPQRQVAKPEHYKVICISMYTDDLEALDEMVKELKKRGLTKANRSALIRQALLQLDLDKVPRGL